MYTDQPSICLGASNDKTRQSAILKEYNYRARTHAAFHIFYIALLAIYKPEERYYVS